jgi:hypothetical protein
MPQQPQQSQPQQQPQQQQQPPPHLYPSYDSISTNISNLQQQLVFNDKVSLFPLFCCL